MLRMTSRSRKRSRGDWAGIPKNKLNDGNSDQSILKSIRLFHIYLYYAVCIRKAILLDPADMRHAGVGDLVDVSR